jgi:hypothetical protein
MRRFALFALLCSSATACATNPYEAPSGEQAAAKPSEPPKKNGVPASAFDCKAFLSEEDVGGAVGQPVTWQKGDIAGQSGTPDPCIYVATTQPAAPIDAGPKAPDAGPSKGIEAWQFHLDCRPVAMGDAQAIIAQYKQLPDARELVIGRGAIDHTNARVIAVDDDTDCAAYVVGPSVTVRTALAQLVLQRLTRENMPRSPNTR